MFSFYPGPSQLHPQMRTFFAKALDSGILSKNHRSPDFVAMSRQTIGSLKEKLDIPQNYTLFFTSSATECWEILGESFLSLFSFHLYNGAFGQKWYHYRRKLSPNAAAIEFSLQKTPSLNKLKALPNKAEVICLTQNESSNGTQLKNRTIRKIRTQFADTLIFVDATSSMAGVVLDWRCADVWFASVQKCFGLPSGMALMVCSPAALEVAHNLRHNQHYNSLIFMAEKMKNFQTTYTPNILNIFLLGEVMRASPPIQSTHRLLKARRRKWEDFFRKHKYPLLVLNSQLRSDTIFALRAEQAKLAGIHEKAAKADLLLGKGYGKWAENTFRIANFPAISEEAIEKLQDLLQKIEN